MRDVPGEENATVLTATDAVLAIGRQRFPDVLMNTLRRVAAIDHCMVFSFTSEGPARCLLNIGNIGIGADLGEAYSHHFYSSDPNRDTILRHQSAPSPIMLPPFARRMYGDSYRKIFFDDSDINDKYATAIWFENICFYVNFYKVGAGAKFSREQIERMRLIASPISAAIARHYEPTSSACASRLTVSLVIATDSGGWAATLVASAMAASNAWPGSATSSTRRHS